MDAVADTQRAWPFIVITLYVDDGTLEMWRKSRAVVQATLSGATDMLVGILENGLCLEVSAKKSLAIGSSPS
eukprot:8634600-Lingulodinium_polyedra.AAC.1